MRILLTFILIILIGTSYAIDVVRHKPYNNTLSSDEAIYRFFSGFLKETDRNLEMLLEEKSEAYENSKELTSKILLTEQEIAFYRLQGVESNASKLLPAFKLLATNFEKLAEAQSEFLLGMERLNNNDSDYDNYIKIISALTQMKTSLRGLNDSIKKIETLGVWNGASYMYFDVSDIKGKIKKVNDLIAYYESLALKYERSFKIEGLVLTVSDTNPYLNEIIEIRVHAINVTPVSLYIDGVKFQLHDDILKYSFNKTGEHILYAEGLKQNQLIRSNIVKVYVSKIPTSILLSGDNFAFLNETVNVNGFVVDYFGNPLNVSILIEYDETKSVVQAKGGLFSFDISRFSEGYMNISATFEGNKTHEASSSTLSVFFSRYLVEITIETNKTDISPNSTIKVFGTVVGVHNPITVEIMVNDTLSQKVVTASKFNTTLFFSNTGKYTIQAKFSGDADHRPAESNVIVIEVMNPSITSEVALAFKNVLLSYNLSFEYIIPSILLAMFLTVIWLLAKRNRMEELEKLEKTRNHKKDYVDVKQEEQNTMYTYSDLFDMLVKRYGLKRGLTPRELLNALMHEGFYMKLSKVTDLHEKLIYARTKLDPWEEKLYIKLISEIMEEII